MARIIDVPERHSGPDAERGVLVEFERITQIDFAIADVLQKSDGRRAVRIRQANLDGSRPEAVIDPNLHRAAIEYDRAREVGVGDQSLDGAASFRRDRVRAAERKVFEIAAQLDDSIIARLATRHDCTNRAGIGYDDQIDIAIGA